MSHINSPQPNESPCTALRQQARAFYGLTVADNITLAFSAYRNLLQQTITLASDPTSFAPAWNKLIKDAAVDLVDFEQGDSMALVKLQHSVAASAELLPQSYS
ncbi:hypothetical protein IC229_26160 [Spirosoma sp. BT702]|uniref:Uncharacterized protein n=1 Tax=Spirosoma profusum TaxID=2771354 RepID=A0A926Y1D9_9BACT|nr:hypothetical protein [Spirosoma profusum]MBD2704155.1 hypothetical protein [Spirosoma profusum]